MYVAARHCVCILYCVCVYSIEFRFHATGRSPERSDRGGVKRGGIDIFQERRSCSFPFFLLKIDQVKSQSWPGQFPKLTRSISKVDQVNFQIEISILAAARIELRISSKPEGMGSGKGGAGAIQKRRGGKSAGLRFFHPPCILDPKMGGGWKWKKEFRFYIH